MANFIIDGNLFKSIQSSIKRDTERFLGKGNGTSVSLSEIREFVVENQNEMFSNGGKQWVVDHFVTQVRNQRSALSVSTSAEKPIIIDYNYSQSKPEQLGQITTQSAPQISSLELPKEILSEIQTKFSGHSQEVQQEIVRHLQELKLQSALELRQKLNELSNLESRLLTKVLTDFRNQHESNLSTLRQTLASTKREVDTDSQNFTQEFKDKIKEIEKMFGL